MLPSSNVNGTEFHVPAEFAGILPISPSSARHQFEPLCYKALHATCAPGMTVYDIGASYGVMTALIASLVGAQGRVVSFEPNPKAHQLATRLHELNGLSPRIQYVQALVGDKSSERVPFFIVPGTSSVSSTRNTDIVHFHPTAEKCDLAMVSIDEFGGPMPSVIKVDIEGSEYLFLQGARRLLAAHHPDLVMETHALEINGIAGTTLKVCELMVELGYQLWDLQRGVPVSAADYATHYAKQIGYLLASVRLPAITPRLLA